VVEGAQPTEDAPLTLEQALQMVREQIAQGKSKKDAVRSVAELTGFPKNTLYDAAIKA